MKRLILLAACLILAAVPGTTLAQGGDESCPALVETALAAAGEACAGLERNTACYGHSLVEATFFEDRDDLVFSAPADRVALADLQTLTTAPLDGEANTWGVALLHLQANLPDTLPGQAVTMLLMGDATLENDVTPEAEDSPMQAFTFTSGLSAPACAEAPNSLVIHSPTGEEVSLTINDLELTLGSTVVLTTAPVGGADSGQAALVISLIEGRLTAQVGGQTIEMTQPIRPTAPAFPTLAVTLNDQGRVDADSRIVEPGLREIQPGMVASCDVLRRLQFIADLDLPDCAAPLEGIPAQSTPQPAPADPNACTLTPHTAVNLRGGPGTVYPIQGQLGAEDSAQADGYAQGADGFRWWRLTSGRWVRSDLVDRAGACAALGEVQAPEPPAAPAQPAGGGAPASYIFDVGTCESGRRGPVDQFRPGDVVTIYQGCRWPSEAEAQAAASGGWITMDGGALDAQFGWVRFLEAEPENNLDAGWEVTVKATWIATPGSHTAGGQMPPCGPHLCTFTVPDN